MTGFRLLADGSHTNCRILSANFRYCHELHRNHKQQLSERSDWRNHHFYEGADLSPGDKLPSESYFARELNKSRTVVREAFRSLAALNLIKLNAGKRAEVAALDYSTISPVIEHGIHTEQISVQQVYDVRRTIEMRTATLAALRRSDTQAETILFHAKSMMAHRDNPEHIMNHDIAFHQTIAMASCNPIFALMIGAFEGVTKLTYR